MSDYERFLQRREVRPVRNGISNVASFNPKLFPFQRAVIEYLLSIGRGAAFLDTGLGKTIIQLEWARVVVEHTNRPVLILAPLAVSAQTVREGQRFGIEARVARSQDDVREPIVYVTNYEKLHRFDPSVFSGVVLDESSILKSFNGSTRKKLTAAFANTQFRLCCTATPAPNDHMEIGQHSDFLGIMPGPEMLSRWFINDTMHFGSYRLKKHAVQSFWRWVASWAVCCSKPSDLGDSNDGFDLPPLDVRPQLVDANITLDRGEHLFRIPEMSATSFHKEKRISSDNRARLAGELVRAEPAEPFIVWCDTNYESDSLIDAIPGAVEIRGSDSEDSKESRLVNFSEGRIKVLVTKPSIAGFGLNWQHCARIIFGGISFSYESFYQAVRRCWRYGQKRPVIVNVIMSQTETGVWGVVQRKMALHDEMKCAMYAENFKIFTEEWQVKRRYFCAKPMKTPSWLVTL